MRSAKSARELTVVLNRVASDDIDDIINQIDKLILKAIQSGKITINIIDFLACVDLSALSPDPIDRIYTHDDLKDDKGHLIELYAIPRLRVNSHAIVEILRNNGYLVGQYTHPSKAKYYNISWGASLKPDEKIKEKEYPLYSKWRAVITNLLPTRSSNELKEPFATILEQQYQYWYQKANQHNAIFDFVCCGLPTIGKVIAGLIESNTISQIEFNSSFSCKYEEIVDEELNEYVVNTNYESLNKIESSQEYSSKELESIEQLLIRVVKKHFEEISGKQNLKITTAAAKPFLKFEFVEGHIHLYALHYIYIYLMLHS